MVSAVTSWASTESPWPRHPFAPHAEARIGVLVNRNAGHGNGAAAALGMELSTLQGLDVRVTASLGEVDGAVRELMARGINVLVVVGGDGSLHHALQSLVHRGRLWPGVLVPLPLGTMNIVAESLEESLRRTLKSRPRELLQQLSKGPWGAIPRRELRLLEVQSLAGSRFGFVFGSQLVKHALEMYESFGGGSVGLARLLFETTRGALFQTELWKKEGWRLNPPESPIDVDGVHLARYSVAFAATCELVAFGGSLRALPSPGASGFPVRVVTERRTSQLIRLIPTLMRNAHSKTAAISEFPQAKELVLQGSYTLDGEVFDGSPADPLRVRVGGSVSVIGAERASLA